MTRKFTEAEVVAKTQELTSSPAVIDRRSTQTAEQIVSTNVELVYRSVNSDIDSVYSLLKLSVAEQVILCTEAISKLSELYELSSSANNPSETFNEGLLLTLRAGVDEARTSQGARQQQAIKNLREQISQFINTGSSGRSPQYARARGLKLLFDSIAIIDTIQQYASRFNKIVDDYMGADFETNSMDGRLEAASEALSLLSNNMTDPNESKLALSIIDGMIDSASGPKRDIRIPKYSGPVTLLPGEPATVEGCTTPMIVYEDAYRHSLTLDAEASIMYSDGRVVETIAVEAPLSHKPTLSINLSSAVFRATDSGELMSAISSVPVAGPRILSSHDKIITVGTDEVALSALTRQSSISYEDETDQEAEQEIVNETVFIPFLKTYVVPHSVTIRLSIAYLNETGFQQQFQGTVEITVPRNNFVETLDYVLVDNGNGALLDQNGASIGTIDYATGAIFLVMPHDIDRRTPVTVTYDYLPFYEARSYIAESGSMEDTGYFDEWDIFSIWEDNYNKAVYSITGIDSPESLLPFFLEISDASIVNDTYRFQHTLGGTSARLSFPYRESIQRNPEPFAPVWETSPFDMNQALGFSMTARPAVFGRDTQASEVTVEGDRLALSVRRKDVLANVTFSGSLFTGLTSDQDISAIQPGDDVHFTSPIEHHVKVTHVANGTVSTWPNPLFPLEESLSDAVLDATPLTATVTRNNIVLTADSDDPYVTLTVVEDGLLLQDVSAATNRFSLGARANVENVETAFGYTIKPGDVVVEKDGDAARPIGTVSSVDGNELTLQLTTENFIYPYQEIEIYALGWSRYKSCAAPIKTISEQLYTQLYENDLLVKGTSYLNSGSGQNAFYQAILALRDNIGGLRNQYLNYEAHVVNTADGLLQHFRQDKLRAFTELLEQCRFKEIAEMTPATLAARSSVEQIMSEASNMLGGDMDYLHRGGGVDLSGDYMAESDHPRGIMNVGFFGDAEEP